MNIIDFFLNNNFTTEYDGGLNSKTRAASIHDLKNTFNIGDITELARDYKGDHYKELVEIILENSAYDVAMNIALINHDYKLCKTIHIERQKVILNKNTYEQKWAVKKSPYNIKNEINSIENEINSIENEDLMNRTRHQLETLRERINKFRAQINESYKEKDEFPKLIEYTCEMNFDDENDIRFMNFLSKIDGEANPHQSLIDAIKKFFPNDSGIKFYFFDEEDMK